MKKVTKILLIIATSCLVCGIALTGAAFALVDFDVQRLSTMSSLTQKSYQAEKSDYQEIVFEGLTENISVVESSSSVVEIEYYENESQSYEIVEKGDSLEITEQYETVSRFFNFNFNIKSRERALIIKIPASFEGSLRLSTMSGDMAVQDIAQAKDLDINAQNSRILLENATFTGDIKVSIGSGDVNAHVISARKFEVDSASGDITMKSFAAEEAVLKTASGDICGQVTGLSDDYKITATSISGDIRVPSGNNAASKNIVMESASGNIELSFSETK